MTCMLRNTLLYTLKTCTKATTPTPSLTPSLSTLSIFPSTPYTPRTQPPARHMSAFRSRLTGAWELISYTSTNTSDPTDIKHPMTKSALGMILYTPDGHMSAQLQFPDIPAYVDGPLQGSVPEYANCARKTMAYAGPFYLDEQPGEMQRLYHHMNLSQPPNWVGDTQVRLAEMREEGGRLHLYLGPEGNVTDGEVTRVVRLKWRKVEDNTGVMPPKDISKL